MLTMSDTVVPMGTICAGLLRPISTGPSTVPPPSSFNWVETWEVCRLGMIRILAGL